MAKDRNTFAKQQRETERKRKATEKREQRIRKKQSSDKVSTEMDTAPALSPAELAVLDVYRKFRMGSGQMLCFSTADIEAFRVPLAELANNGLLVAEKFQGGYSLTQAGYAAMRDGG